MSTDYSNQIERELEASERNTAEALRKRGYIVIEPKEAVQLRNELDYLKKDIEQQNRMKEELDAKAKEMFALYEKEREKFEREKGLKM